MSQITIPEDIKINSMPSEEMEIKINILVAERLLKTLSTQIKLKEAFSTISPFEVYIIPISRLIKQQLTESSEIKATNMEIKTIIEDVAGVERDQYLFVLISEEIIDKLKKPVFDSLKEFGAPVVDVEIHYDESIGFYALAILDCDAHQALEYWLKIVSRIREYSIPIFIMWKGNIDITPEEMGTYIGKVLAKMNVFLATKKPLDIVKILREEWGS